MVNQSFRGADVISDQNEEHDSVYQLEQKIKKPYAAQTEYPGIIDDDNHSMKSNMLRSPQIVTTSAKIQQDIGPAQQDAKIPPHKRYAQNQISTQLPVKT